MTPETARFTHAAMSELQRRLRATEAQRDAAIADALLYLAYPTVSAAFGLKLAARSAMVQHGHHCINECASFGIVFWRR